MSELLHELIAASAERHPEAEAVAGDDACLDYAALEQAVQQFAECLVGQGLRRGDRVAVWLDKRVQTVVALFGASRAGGIFVPVNPVLKEPQVLHILRDCEVAMLITSTERHARLEPHLRRGDGPRRTILVDGRREHTASTRCCAWQTFLQGERRPVHRHIDADVAAILYTSGSTGRAKGVVLSHHNMVAGARSVAHYLGNTGRDRLLALLPLSFDAGFSQLTTAFQVGASVVLHNYLLPRDVPRVIARESVTGLGAVPPVWIPLARLDWPEAAVDCLRYVTNTGGAMPRPTLNALRAQLPRTRIFLMYGLTEAFRSTYLPPEEIDRRPGSIGKAIPNAEILVVRPDGTPCADDEPGELVHRGALVAQGYWNDADKTAERFRPAPAQLHGVVPEERAVWSGDTVRRDRDGFLYFVGRDDEMIKTSGYRVSPTEVEEALFASGMVAEVAAFGLPDPELGQSIVATVVPAAQRLDVDALLAHCRRQLPAFMVPARIEIRDALPRNANAKIDRARVRDELLSALG